MMKIISYELVYQDEKKLVKKNAGRVQKVKNNGPISKTNN